MNYQRVNEKGKPVALKITGHSEVDIERMFQVGDWQEIDNVFCSKSDCLIIFAKKYRKTDTINKVIDFLGR